MKRIVLVNVQSVQKFEDHTDQIKSQARGTHLVVGDTHCIAYKEQLEGNLVVNNTLTIKAKKASLNRKGDIVSNMSFFMGKTTQFTYQSKFGCIPFEIETIEYHRKVSEESINAMILYRLKIKKQTVSLNTLSIHVQFLEE